MKKDNVVHFSGFQNHNLIFRDFSSEIWPLSATNRDHTLVYWKDIYLWNVMPRSLVSLQSLFLQPYAVQYPTIIAADCLRFANIDEHNY